MAAIDAVNWPTAATRDYKGESGSGRQERKGYPADTLPNAVAKHGQAAPANHSTDGSRQGLWRTPSVAEEKNQNTSTQIYLQNQVGATPKAWATPRSGKTTDENPETWALRQAKGDVATMPLTAQVKAWATPRSCEHKGHGPNSKQQGLCNQVTQWGTPTARDHKSGRGNEEREYKELTPMVERTQAGKLNPRWVETLMGLPVGWVMPSCASPVTIAPTNFGSSATESCQPPPNELFEC
jgi:hypothetical protein